jgi:hypothetical protein
LLQVDHIQLSSSILYINIRIQLNLPEPELEQPHP